jgi:hypothetical protein
MITVIEVLAESPNSWEEAAQTAVKEADPSVRGLGNDQIDAGDGNDTIYGSDGLEGRGIPFHGDLFIA